MARSPISLLAAAACVAAAAFPVDAVAQPREAAPISYLGAGPSAAPALVRAPAQTAGQAYAALPASDYGYGAQRQAGSGIIDLTRPTARNRDPDLTNPPQDPPELQNEADGPEDDAAVPPQPAQTAAAQPAAQAAQRPAWLETERVGPPYEANGQWYAPTPEPGYEQTGTASWYGPDFHGRQTASGDVYDQDGLTAAHPTLPLNSLVQVTNLENNREIIVRVNDRGPFVNDRLIDLSRGGATALGFQPNGTTRVHVRYLGPAPRQYGEQSIAPAAAVTAQAEPVMRRSAPAPAPVPAGAFVVQVGAFSDLSNAHRVRAAVESAGQVLVEPRETAHGEVFRVRVGGYGSRAEAEAARRQIAQLGYPEAVVAAR